MICKSNIIQFNLILALIDVIAGHSWLDCVDVKEDNSCAGYIRGYDGHLDEHQTYKLLGRPMNSPICNPTRQGHPDNYDDQYPRAVAEPGDNLTFFYLENGHVTKDRLAPDGRPSPKQFTIHWTGKPYTGERLEGNQILTRGELGPSNQLGSAYNFDDGRCAEDNTRGRMGPKPCQGTMTLPNNIVPGIYQFIWFWKFDKDFKGIGEEYTSCFDVEVTPKGAKSTYVPKKYSKKQPYLPKLYQSNFSRLNMTMDDEMDTFKDSPRLGQLPKFAMENIPLNNGFSKSDIPTGPPSDRVWQQLLNEIRAASVKPQAPMSVPPSVQPVLPPMPHMAPMTQIPSVIPPALPQSQPPSPQSQPPSPQAFPARPGNPNPPLAAQSVPNVSNDRPQVMSATNNIPVPNVSDASAKALAPQPVAPKPVADQPPKAEQAAKTTNTQSTKPQTLVDPSTVQQRVKDPVQSDSKSKNDLSEQKIKTLITGESATKAQSALNNGTPLSLEGLSESEKNMVNLQNKIKNEMESFNQSQKDIIAKNNPEFAKSRLGKPETSSAQIPFRSGEEQVPDEDQIRQTLLTDSVLNQEPEFNSDRLPTGRLSQHAKDLPEDLHQHMGHTHDHSAVDDTPLTIGRFEQSNPTIFENDNRHQVRPIDDELFSTRGRNEAQFEDAGPLTQQDLEKVLGHDMSQPHHHNHPDMGSGDRFELSDPRENLPRLANTDEPRVPFESNRDSELVEKPRLPLRPVPSDDRFEDNEPLQRMRPHAHFHPDSVNDIPAELPHDHHHSLDTEVARIRQDPIDAEATRDRQHPVTGQVPHDRQDLIDTRLAQELLAGLISDESSVTPAPQHHHSDSPSEHEMRQAQPMVPLSNAPGLRSQIPPRVPFRNGRIRSSGSEDVMPLEEEDNESQSQNLEDEVSQEDSLDSTLSVPSNDEASSSNVDPEAKEVSHIPKSEISRNPIASEEAESEFEGPSPTLKDIDAIPRPEVNRGPIASEETESEFEGPNPTLKDMDAIPKPVVNRGPIVSEEAESEFESPNPTLKDSEANVVPEKDISNKISQDPEQLEVNAPEALPAPPTPPTPPTPPSHPSHPSINPEETNIEPHQKVFSSQEEISDSTNLQSPLPELTTPAPVSSVEPIVENAPAVVQPNSDAQVKPQSEEIAIDVMPE